MVLLKGAGFNRVSDAERIVSALRTSLPGNGLYFLPSIILGAGVVSYLLSLTVAMYWRRIALAGLLGASGWFAISSIYWSW